MQNRIDDDPTKQYENENELYDNVSKEYYVHHECTHKRMRHIGSIFLYPNYNGYLGCFWK